MNERRLSHLYSIIYSYSTIQISSEYGCMRGSPEQIKMSCWRGQAAGRLSDSKEFRQIVVELKFRHPWWHIHSTDGRISRVSFCQNQTKNLVQHFKATSQSSLTQLLSGKEKLIHQTLTSYVMGWSTFFLTCYPTLVALLTFVHPPCLVFWKGLIR